MSEVDLTGGLLRRIASQNNFALPNEYLVFAGIRGATPVDADDLAFASARRVRITPPDYESMRCTLARRRVGCISRPKYKPKPGTGTASTRRGFETAANRNRARGRVLAPKKVARMYIRSLKIRDLRAVHSARLKFLHPGMTDSNAVPSWPRLDNFNVLLGENGAGKSTLLDGIALAVLSPIIAQAGYRPCSLIRRGLATREPRGRSSTSRWLSMTGQPIGRSG